MKKLLKNKLFISLFAADLLSNFGDGLYYLALMTYVAQLPDPKLGLSAVSLSETLPMLFSFAIGIKADQAKKKLELILGTLLVRVGLYSLVGLLMGLTPALWVVLVASLINFVSDLAGQYENGLYSPIGLRLVAAEEREQSMAFRGTISSLMGMVFQVSGAVLVGILSYQQLAFVNAGTFAVAALVLLGLKPAIQQLLDRDPIKVANQSEGKRPIFKEMWQSAKQVFDFIKTSPVLKQLMIIVPIVNALCSVLNTIFVLSLTQNPELVWLNLAFSLSASSMVFMVGNLLGGSLGMTVAQKWDVFFIIRLLAIMPALIFASLFWLKTPIFLLSLFLTACLIGLINPKLNALVVNTMPEEHLATIGAGISTYFTTGMLLSRFLVSGLVLVFTARQLSGLFLVLSLGLVAVMIWDNSRAAHQDQA